MQFKIATTFKRREFGNKLTFKWSDDVFERQLKRRIKKKIICVADHGEKSRLGRIDMGVE